MRQLVKWVDARQKTSGGVVLWGDMRALAIAIDDNSARLEFLESEHDEQCKAIGNASAAAAKNASNAIFWTDKYLEATNELARLKQELAKAQELLKAERTHNYWNQWREAVHSRESMQRDMQQQIDDARADAAQARKSFAGWRAAQRLTEERDALAEKLEKIRDLYKATDYRTWCGLVTLDSLREQLGDILDS